MNFVTAYKHCLVVAFLSLVKLQEAALLPDLFSQLINGKIDPSALIRDNIITNKNIDSVLINLSQKAPEKLQPICHALSQYAANKGLELLDVGISLTTGTTGFAQAKFDKKFGEIKAQLDTMLDAPTKEAMIVYQRGMQSFLFEKWDIAYDEFKQVVKKSITARIYKHTNQETLGNIAKLISFADLMVISYDKKHNSFTPYELLKDKEKSLIQMKIRDHIEKLIVALEDKNTSFFQMFRLSSTKKEEQVNRQNLLDGVLKNTLQYICPPGTPIPLKFVPHGIEDAAEINIEGDESIGHTSEETVYIFQEEGIVVIQVFKTVKIAQIDAKEVEELLIKSTQSGIIMNGRPLEINKQILGKKLLEASENGDISSVKRLLMWVDVNVVDVQGNTALIEASRYGHSEVVTLLLQHPNVQVNSVSNYGSTALMMASRYGYSEVVTLLLQHPNVHVNSVDSRGWTALMFASWHGSSEVVTLLLQQPDIQINKKRNSGRTALHDAAEEGHLNIVKLLVKAGADITAVDEDGLTPAQVASFDDIKKYLNSL